MRLFFLFLIVVLIAAGAAVVLRFLRRSGDAAAAAGMPPPDDPEVPLAKRLRSASKNFRRAARLVGRRFHPLRSAITGLSEQCARLADRVGADEGFERRSRMAVLRLVYPLYGVVDRAVIASRQPDDGARDGLLNSAAALIQQANDALGAVADRADESALRHFEADLEILEERLKDDAPPR